MSFQGDVGGIGLADLLQSLSRGREGVLLLQGDDGQQAAVGVQRGLVHLLPHATEEATHWLQRARDSQLELLEPELERRRMEQIARAVRLETLYSLLDASTVHFSFEPSSLEEAQAASQAVRTTPVAMEALLLEYARLSDELQQCQDGWTPAAGEVPCLSGLPCDDSVEHARFVRSCDGASSVQELADRLGVPLRQARLWCARGLEHGDLVLASAHDLWSLAHHELAQARPTRAAQRMEIALAADEAGPLDEELARELDHEWATGRLDPALRLLPRRAHRSFLWRLEPAAATPVGAAARAQVYAKLYPLDDLGALHNLRCGMVVGGGNRVPDARQLCATARRFLDRERRLAAEPLLRLAAKHARSTPAARMEIGQLMLEAGMAHEAAPYILETAREHINRKRPAKALPLLKQLLELAPDLLEAKQLQSQARGLSVRMALVRKHTLVGAALVLVLASAGVVQWREAHDRAERLEQVHALAHEPQQALRLLGALFTSEETQVDAELLRLRDEFEQRIRAAAEADCRAWMEEWKSIAAVSASGDLGVALESALALRPAPKPTAGMEELPLVGDLFLPIAARIEQLLRRLPETVGEAETELAAEAHVLRTSAQLRSLLLNHTHPEAAPLDRLLGRMQARLGEREAQRVRERVEREKRSLQERQEILIRAARAAAAARDWTQAAAQYERLLAIDENGLLAKGAAGEVAQARERAQFLAQAEDLALQGNHAQALRLLATEFPGEVRTLPWTLTTFPAQAHVRTPDGVLHSTPVQLRSAPGQVARYQLSAPGCDPIELEVDQPSDRSLAMSRTPLRKYTPRARVEAQPVRAGDDDTILADRAGVVTRLDSQGRIAWSKDLHSLGGFACTPRFLPERPGTLLLVSEDGNAWLVDARTGLAEGPLALSAVPGSDLWTEGREVRVQLKDGTTLAWSAVLEPLRVETAETQEPARGRETFHLLRRRDSDQTSLSLPNTGYVATIVGDVVVVSGAGERLWTAAIEGSTGEWIAWEAPSSKAPGGRLWISDRGSVRAMGN